MQTNQIRNYFLILFLIFSSLLFSQKEEILVTGTMTDSSGLPIPGLSVTIEGTSKGTITDIDGNYAIKAPLGSTLVFSFIGMKTQRAKVTRTGLNPIGTHKILQYNNVPESTRYTREEEKKELNDSVRYNNRMKDYKEYLADPTILVSYQRAYDSADTIQSQKILRQLLRYSNPGRVKFYQLGDIVVETHFSVEEVGRTPSLQSTFAQGRPLNGELRFQGPETAEMFSWGPRLRNLEYDGIANSYNQNGALVLRGDGNGNKATYYDPKNIFQTGFSKSFGITTYQKIIGAELDLSYRNQMSSGILPSEDYGSHLFRMKLNIHNMMKISASYSKSEDNLKDGPMRSRVLASAYLTPVSFDNTNGLSALDAQKKSSSIYLPDGSLRSASVGILNNPYFLTRKAAKSNNTESLLYQVNFNQYWNAGHIDAHFSSEYFKKERDMFFPEGTVGLGSGRGSVREEKMTNYYLGALVENRLIGYNFRIKAPIRVELYDYKRNIKYYQSLPSEVVRDRKILTANPVLEYKNQRNNYFIQGGVNLYTSKTSNKVYYRPNVGMYIKPFEVLDDVFYWDTKLVMQNFKVQFDYVTHINEYNLNAEAGLCNSLQYSVADFFSYFEDKEIEITNNIAPELITKRDLSVEASFVNGKIRSETSFYFNTGKNRIFPVFKNDVLTYNNVGDIKTKGWEESLTARIINRDFKWRTNLVLSRIQSEVTKLKDHTPISIAGFKDVHTALVEGKAPGVIMGNTFIRNDEGKMIMDEDGFPLADQSLTVIGDPNPDLMLGLTNTFNIVGMEFGFTIDCTFGGDVWNGTQSALDYYGVSQHTANMREVNNYIFDGVKQDGLVNNIPVSFAPQNGDVFKNRWVRYGQGGVAEDYIEDGSRIVFKELFLTYNFQRRTVEKWGLEDLSVSFIANNLVTISGYRGGIASNTLWGHSNTLGLDYFNNPQIRKYELSLKITF